MLQQTIIAAIVAEMDGDENDMIPVKDMNDKEKYNSRSMFHERGKFFSLPLNFEFLYQVKEIFRSKM